MLMRSSRSPIFNEIGDLVTVIFDRNGNTLAQAEFAAIIAFGAHPSLEYIIEYFGDDIHEATSSSTTTSTTGETRTPTPGSSCRSSPRAG